MLDAELFGNYLTRSFADIFPSYNDFKTAYDAFPTTAGLTLTTAEVTTIYYLLYGTYGNSVTASTDENRFKAQVFNTIFMYGPTWSRKMAIQSTLRTLTEADILAGSRVLYNTAEYTGGTIADATTDELAAINSQNATKHKKSKLEGYSMLYSILSDDITKEFINRFKSLFNKFASPTLPLWYATEIEEDT